MADVQLICVNTIPGNRTHEGITHLGGFSSWWTRGEVIASIETCSNMYYTLIGGERAEVGVVSGLYGKHVRTHVDGVYNDNLLALPDCR